LNFSFWNSFMIPERHARHLFGGRPLAVFEGHQRAIDPEHRRQAGLQVNVADATAQGDLKNLVQFHFGVLPR
jgi:hypothetical protein